MQNLKVRWKPYRYMVNLNRPLGLLFQIVFKNLLLDNLIDFWLKSCTFTEITEIISLYLFPSLCCFSPYSTKSQEVQCVVRPVTSKGKLWRLSTDKMKFLNRSFEDKLTLVLSGVAKVTIITLKDLRTEDMKNYRLILIILAMSPYHFCQHVILDLTSHRTTKY